jgi:hypothetical protein
MYQQPICKILFAGQKKSPVVSILVPMGVGQLAINQVHI